MAQVATVVSVTGKAYAYNPVTKIARLLKAGDAIDRDEIVQTAAGANVNLAMADGKTLAIAPEHAVRLDESVTPSDATQSPTAQDAAVRPETVIQALERGGDLNAQLEATAAGLAGGGGAQGNAGFVRIIRIVENLDPLAFIYETDLGPSIQTLESEPIAQEPAAELPVLALRVFAVDQNPDGSYTVRSAPVAEGTTALYVVLPVDADGNPLTTIPAGSVDVAFTDGTAGSADYQATNVTVELGQIFSADILDDYLADAGENFNIDATNYSNAADYASVSYTGTVSEITDNSSDGPGIPGGPEGPDGSEDTVTIQVFAVVDGQLLPANSVPEGERASYVVHLVGPDGEIIEGATGDVTIAFRNGTADDSDYSTTTTTIALGQTFTADATDDSEVEPSENFTVDASDYTNAAAYENVAYGSSVTTTITDNDVPPTEPPPTEPPPTEPPPTEPPAPSITVTGIPVDDPLLNNPVFNPDSDAGGSVVEEGTNAYFKVTYDLDGATADTITLNFTNGGDGNAANDTSAGDLADKFYYWNQVNSEWVEYSGSVPLTALDGKDLYVRILTVSDDINESSLTEDFTLTAELKNSTTQLATDNALGGIFEDPPPAPTIDVTGLDLTGGVPPGIDPEAFNPDGDAGGSTVEEGKRAYFQVTYDLDGATADTITLVFSDNGSSDHPTDSTATPPDFGPTFEYWDYDDNTWVGYSTGVSVDMLDGNTLYVRVQTNLDEEDESAFFEDFTLTATLKDGSSTLVVDDAPGAIFEGEPPPPPVPTIDVTGLDLTEGLPPGIDPENPDSSNFNPDGDAGGSRVEEGERAYFEVSYDSDGAPADKITLAFSNGSASGNPTEDGDFGPSFEYWDYGTYNWETYTDGVLLEMLGGNDLYVRVQTNIDTDNESGYDELFTLTAKLKNSTTTLVEDDAEGAIYESPPPDLSSDNYKTFEQSTTTFANVIGLLANDSNVAGLVIAKVGQVSDDDSAVTVDGSNTLTTALGGTVTMNEDGSFTYHIGALDHENSSQDSFWYAVEDPRTEALVWQQVTIDIADTKPDALNNYHVVDIDAATSTPDTASGNVMTSGSLFGDDVIGADATTLTKVIFNGKEYDFNDVSEQIIPGDFGTLVIQANGDYTYTATNGKTLLDTSSTNWNVQAIAAIEASSQKEFTIDDLGISGTTTNSWDWSDITIEPNGTQTNIKNFFSNEETLWDKGSKTGWGVKNADDNGNSAAAIAPGDAFVIDIGFETTSSIGVNFVQANQANGYWVGYDGEGKIVESHDLITEGNGFGFDVVLEPSAAVQYIVFGGYDSSQGYYLEEVVLLENGIDTFQYTITDADGDFDTANLVFGPSDQSGAGTGSDALDPDDLLLDAVEDVLNLPEGSASVTDADGTAQISIESDGSNAGAEQTIAFDSLTTEQLKHVLDDNTPYA
jgi:VCBS repeat-containing protein